MGHPPVCHISGISELGWDWRLCVCLLSLALVWSVLYNRKTFSLPAGGCSIPSGNCDLKYIGNKKQKKNVHYERLKPYPINFLAMARIFGKDFIGS